MNRKATKDNHQNHPTNKDNAASRNEPVIIRTAVSVLQQRLRTSGLFRSGALIALICVFIDQQFGLLLVVTEMLPRDMSQKNNHITILSLQEGNASLLKNSSTEEVILKGAWFRDTCDGKANMELTSHVENIPLGTQKIPQWIEDLCPEVVEHYEMFPSFVEPFIQVAPINKSQEMAISTTLTAALGVCTMQIAQKIAANIGEDFFIYAGSLLGAILHGQPMPWDDDFDAAIRFHARHKYMEACKKSKNLAPGVTLHCDGKQFGFIKVWLQGPTSVKNNPARYTHWFPFLDIFFLGENATHFYELRGWKKKKKQRIKHDAHNKSVFFPTRSYYFGGIQVDGFNQHVYDTPKCLMSTYSHRMEATLKPYRGQNTQLDCCRLSKHLPFLYTYNDSSVIYNGLNMKSLLKPSLDENESNGQGDISLATKH